jgi:lysophospholipase L1-like esterase
VAAAPDTQLLFLGDSIAESLKGDCTRPECVEQLPLVWAKLFAPHKALALGVSGDRTENLLYRLAGGETAGLSPSLVVIEIGTNNLAFGHSAEATAYGIEAVVRSVREKLPGTHVALTLLFPRPKDKGTDLPWKEIDVVNELLQEQVRGTPGVSIIDCTRPFLVDGKVDLSKLPDGVHPNGKGAEAWGKCLQRVMNRYLPE